MRTSAPPSSDAHTWRARAACRPNRENFPDSDRHAPMRSRPSVLPSASTAPLSHLLFVPELVPVGCYNRVLHFHREIVGVEDGPQYADNGYPRRQPECDSFFMCWHPGHQIVDRPRDLPPDRPFWVFDQSVDTASDP